MKQTRWPKALAHERVSANPADILTVQGSSSTPLLPGSCRAKPTMLASSPSPVAGCPVAGELLVP